MGFRKRLDKQMQQLAGQIADVQTNVSALEIGMARVNALIERVEELEKKLAELEPELERYKQDAEEAAEYEKRRNDGMEAIFGYMTPGMRGGENG